MRKKAKGPKILCWLPPSWVLGRRMRISILARLRHDLFNVHLWSDGIHRAGSRPFELRVTSRSCLICGRKEVKTLYRVGKRTSTSPWVHTSDR